MNKIIFLKHEEKEELGPLFKNPSEELLSQLKDLQQSSLQKKEEETRTLLGYKRGEKYRVGSPREISPREIKKYTEERRKIDIDGMLFFCLKDVRSFKKGHAYIGRKRYSHSKGFCISNGFEEIYLPDEDDVHKDSKSWNIIDEHFYPVITKMELVNDYIDLSALPIPNDPFIKPTISNGKKHCQIHQNERHHHECLGKCDQGCAHFNVIKKDFFVVVDLKSSDRYNKDQTLAACFLGGC